jgi:hypothetical protein
VVDNLALNPSAILIVIHSKAKKIMTHVSMCWHQVLAHRVGC